MAQEAAPPIEPPLLHASTRDDAARRKRVRWVWIILGVGAFAVWTVVVLGVFSTLVVPKVLRKLSVASNRKVVSDVHTIDSALEEFAIANGGKFPDSLEALVTPDVNGETFLDASRVPTDAWGREFIYEPPGPGQPWPIVRSYGRDGQPGGVGDDADVDNLSIRARAHR